MKSESLFHNVIRIKWIKPNALDFSLYIARQMSSIVECCREGGGQTLSNFHSTWNSTFHGCII